MAVAKTVGFVLSACLVPGAGAVQKFTRPLTREIELGSARLALTFSESGVSIRPVGSRKTPWEVSWNTLVCYATGQLPKVAMEATAEEAAAAVELLRKGAPSKGPAPAPPASDKSPPAGTTTHDGPPGAPAKVGPLLARLESWFRSHRPRYLEGLLPGAGASDLEAMQAGLNHPLPADLRALLSWHNGQSGEFVGHLENNWDLMNTSQITAAKLELDGGDLAQTGWQKAWVPFLDDNNGDYMCVDASHPEGPVREFWQGKAKHPVVAPSLAAWIEQFVTGIEEGAYHEDPERGTFLRSRG
jgi:cell wall assembly regulator SMI1